MVEAVQQKGGEVLIFSSMHESGERTSTHHSCPLRTHAAAHHLELNQLTGVAAILTFPLDVELALEDEKADRERETGDDPDVNK